MTPGRCLCANPQNLGMCYFIWQKGLGRYDETKDLKMGDDFGWSGRAP